MYCWKCGKEIRDDSCFCAYCGAQMRHSSGHTQKQEPAAGPQIEIQMQKQIFAFGALSAPEKVETEVNRWLDGQKILISNIRINTLICQRNVVRFYAIPGRLEFEYLPASNGYYYRVHLIACCRIWRNTKVVTEAEGLMEQWKRQNPQAEIESVMDLNAEYNGGYMHSKFILYR